MLTPQGKKVLVRLPLVALAILCLVLGVWGGLIRLPIQLPFPANDPNWILFHGPLMVCGFLGTVIALERAVGLPGWWTFAAPALTGLGGAFVLFSVNDPTGMVLITAGSAAFVLVTLQVIQLQVALFTIVMCLGACAWVTGNILWWHDWPFNRVVPWWIAFLVLTIVGERLDLSRFQRQVPISRPLFLLSLAVFIGGVILGSVVQKPGQKVMGIGLVALALWLARFDLARKTVKNPGLSRYMALCLLIGYGWMALAGVLFILVPPLTAGNSYDAPLHAIFLGFVFSMIFGHAPVIFPSIVNRPVAFSLRFYIHLTLLHLGLLIRMHGDMAGLWPARVWGGVISAIAIAVFMVNTVTSLFAHRPPPTRPMPPKPTPPK